MSHITPNSSLRMLGDASRCSLSLQKQIPTSSMLPPVQTPLGSTVSRRIYSRFHSLAYSVFFANFLRRGNIGLYALPHPRRRISPEMPCSGSILNPTCSDQKMDLRAPKPNRQLSWSLRVPVALSEDVENLSVGNSI